ncbi:nucleotidyl transferase AbiEii/AbiGii toxin family protein [Candidatus Curtissbacteria bacterium]|nr:nucleotidyl transferase AbiEii/AbiGii toxin family protein [Candidatus Curtissbacteria bacterium]
MFTKAISSHTADALAILGKSGILNSAYLAGGTACALHLGHRFSHDLDFFTDQEFPTKVVVNQLQKLKGYTPARTAKWTILGSFPEVKFSYFYYPYPLIGGTSQFLGLGIASLEDIAAMKIAAICDRGVKRDFIDLYFIAKKITVREALNLYDKKYQKLANNLYHILKSLQYFGEADQQELPEMITGVSWDKVKTFFRKEVRKLSHKLLGI